MVDPLGGINTLWPLFGIANQMLAGMALMLCAVVLFKMKRQRYAWVALLPTSWLLICTLTAGWQKSFSPDTKVGFLAIANKFQAMIDSGNIPPQYTESQLAQLVFNNRLDAGLTIFFMIVVVVLALFSIKTALAALKRINRRRKRRRMSQCLKTWTRLRPRRKGALTGVPGGGFALPGLFPILLSLWERLGVRDTKRNDLCLTPFPKQVSTWARRRR